MTKRKNSKFSVCKKVPLNFENIWGISPKKTFRSFKVDKKNKKKFSLFNKLIKTKQCFKNFYTNISEQKFKNEFIRCKKASTKILDKFVSYSERRLDIVLFRSGFVVSLHEARQLVSHGHVFVNFKKVYLSGQKIYCGDSIKISKNNLILKKKIYNNVKNFLKIQPVSSHLEVNYKLLTIVFLWSPGFKSSFFPVYSNYKVISRFYK